MTGEHHLHMESPRAAGAAAWACPQGACSIPFRRASRGAGRGSRHAASAASEGRKEASLPVLRSFHRTQWKRFLLLFL